MSVLVQKSFSVYLSFLKSGLTRAIVLYFIPPNLCFLLFQFVYLFVSIFNRVLNIVFL